MNLHNSYQFFFVVVFSYSVHADIKCICVWTRSVKSVPALDIQLAFHAEVEAVYEFLCFL